MKFQGKVTNGKTQMYQPSQVHAWVQSLEGKEVTVTIEKTKVKKTKRQNNGLFLLLDLFTKELNQLTGNDFSLDEVKDIIKMKRNMKVTVCSMITGEVIGEKLRSISDLDLPETSDLISWLYAYAANEWNIELPELKQIE